MYKRQVPKDEAVGVLAAYVFSADDDISQLVETIRSESVPQLEQQGGVPLGLFRSSGETNNFPILPFIEDERVVVLFVSFASRAEYLGGAELAGDLPLLESFALAPESARDSATDPGPEARGRRQGVVGDRRPISSKRFVITTSRVAGSLCAGFSTSRKRWPSGEMSHE